MTDKDAADMLSELKKYVTFPDFLELLQQFWMERYTRGDAALAPTPKPIPVSWFLFLQGEREMIMTMRSKKKNPTFWSVNGKSTVKPVFYIINATVSKKFSGVVSIYKAPTLDEGDEDQWTSDLKNGWVLKVTRTKESGVYASGGSPHKNTRIHFWGGTEWATDTRYELHYTLIDNGKEYDEFDEPLPVRGGSRFITVQHPKKVSSVNKMGIK